MIRLMMPKRSECVLLQNMILLVFESRKHRKIGRTDVAAGDVVNTKDEKTFLLLSSKCF
jgi:hypothetical protein